MFPFDKDLWHALSPLLDQALDLDAPSRHAFIATIGRDRPHLAPILTRLLDQHDRLLGAEFLESALTIDDAPWPSLAGRAIGAYTLQAPLGMGGMGTVWRARRSDGRFEGSVAVKLLNLALLDGLGDERFKREGTLLARLAHPHIARLLDAGLTSGGQPYLVLEYVDGLRIDRFADDRRLTAVERLQLFLQVADAVAHAHANLIVHRDLKPSNILVGADGQVKLLDFGVASLLEEEPMRERTVTLPSALALTPEYAAPEQARGEAISTATDVYALGVLLHTLLTGGHPTGDTCRTPTEHLSALLEREPVRASDAVMAPSVPAAIERAAARRATPERLRRMFRGDIDNVLVRALEKPKERRYLSVTAFTDDIRRFLNHEPLSVRGPSWRYRSAKFIRRHQWPVAAAVVAFAALSVGLVVVNQQRRIAENRFRQLRQLALQMFELDNRVRDLPGATQAREALVAASLAYLGPLAADASGDVDLLQETSEGYWRVARIQGVPVGLTLGNFAKAEESLKKADELIDVVLRSRPRDRRALEHSAVIAHDRMILADSERRDADALVHARLAVERQDAAIRLDTTPPRQPDPAWTIYNNVALAFVNLHRYDDAARLAARTLEIAHGPAAAQARIHALTVLANARRYQGDLDGALSAIRDARATAEQGASGSDSKRMFDRYPLLLREAFILGEDRAISLNRPDEAAALLRDAFEMHQAGARRDPNDFTSRTRVGTTGRELGNILRWRAPQEAIAVYDVALARLAEIQDNPKARRDRALVLANSSYALRQLNRMADARRRVDEAWAILEAIKDAPADRVALDSELCSVLQAIADQSAGEGRTAEAIAQYEALLQKVVAAKPDIERDLREAYALSLMYADLARLLRGNRDSAKADAVEAKRRALWLQWSETQPANAFVRQQLTTN